MARVAGIEEAIEQAGGIVPPARQGELLPPAPAAPKTGEQPRGVGRPAGSRNKRTEEFRRELAEGGKMPWQFLAELFRADTVELASKLRCKPGEVLAQQRLAAETLMAYTEQQLPRDINVDGKGAMVFAMVDPASLIGDGADRGQGPIRIAKTEGNQGVVDATATPVGQRGVGQDEPSR